jgi:uncharacterized protein YijF (DUF1287 family)
MKNRMDKRRSAPALNYRYFIYAGIIIALLQFLALKTFYGEQEVIKLPEKLFQSPVQYPMEELIPESGGGAAGDGSRIIETGDAPTASEEVPEEGSEGTGNGEALLTDIQKQIVLRLLELVEEDISYGYETYPETGYPPDDVWISTDVISMVLNDVGFDLMELIFRDMSENKQDYPMDIKGGRAPIKYIDFRDVFFQEQFFKRNALELPLEFDRDDPNNPVLWQPGDILYFQFDPDNPYKDLGGFVSPRTNDEGIPLVIMISAELESVSEVDVLEEYTIVGHYRYPPPEVD